VINAPSAMVGSVMIDTLMAQLPAARAREMLARL
jgi:hypothetical protein